MPIIPFLRSKSYQPSGGSAVERVYPSAITQTSYWASFDISLIADDPENSGNTSRVDHSSANNNNAVYFQVSWPSTTDSLSGDQQLLLRVQSSFAGGRVRLLVFEGSTFKADLGAQSTSTTVSVLTWSFSDDLLSNPSALQVRVKLEDSSSTGYYSIYGLAWDRRTGAAGSQPSAPSWPSGWGSRPALGSHHGIGQAFNFSYNSQGELVWQPLRDYNAWLGRPSNIVKVWPNMTSSGIANWDGVAGGAGSSDTTWGGQINELNPNRALDPTYWSVASPVVLALTAVPLSHSNAQNSSNGQWGRPGIWSEIANGTYDIYYQRLFRRIATRCGSIGRDPRTVVIRWCWEANGNWYPHSVGPDKTNFIAAWRRCMDTMRNAVGAVLGAGKSFMIEFGPAGHLRFGNGASERLWNIYPGDDWVDICGLGIHDQVGIAVQADWDKYLRYPATIAGTPFEGIIDWFDFAASRDKWVGTSEIESNYIARNYFPKTQNMAVMWTTGFEPLRQRYDGRFLYFIYLWNGNSALRRPDGWGEPYRQLYKP